jgi:hypothetical protein
VEGRRTRLEAARLIAMLPDAFEREVVILLQDEDGDVAAAALHAVAGPSKPGLVANVIDQLMRNIMSGDAIVRYRIITALNKLLQQHPDGRVDRRLLDTLLQAEIIGHYRSYQTLAASELRLGPGAQAIADTMRNEAERIFRLLKMLHPEHDMHSAYVGLQSNDPIVHDNAVEFLDAVLTPELRSLVIPLFDRDVSPRDRAHIAAQLLNAPIPSF